MPCFSAVAIDIDAPIGRGCRGMVKEDVGFIEFDNRSHAGFSVTVTVTMLAPIANV